MKKLFERGRLRNKVLISKRRPGALNVFSLE
jgi:hypothetical protein